MTRKKPITDLALFQEKTVRRLWHEEQWFYSVIDVIAALTRSERPSKYWDDLKRKLKFEGYVEVTEHIQRLKMAGADGKNYPTDAVDTKTLLRVIQSIPSPSAEPFKRWLAKVGAQRLEEIDNPELLAIRQREYYKAKGYPEEWIEAL